MQPNLRPYQPVKLQIFFAADARLSRSNSAAYENFRRSWRRPLSEMHRRRRFQEFPLVGGARNQRKCRQPRVRRVIPRDPLIFCGSLSIPSCIDSGFHASRYSVVRDRRSSVGYGACDFCSQPLGIAFSGISGVRLGNTVIRSDHEQSVLQSQGGKGCHWDGRR